MPDIEVKVDDVADQILPLDGPYPPEGVVAAGRLTAELIRRLNHATQGGTMLPIEVDDALALLETTLTRMPQLLQQLAEHLEKTARRPALSADASAPIGMSAREVAEHGAAAARTSSYHLEDAARMVGAARAYTARLYLNDGEG